MCRAERFLNQAADEASRSELDIKHGALLVRSGKVIGAGHNSSRTRISAAPGAFSGVSLHSEVRLGLPLHFHPFRTRPRCPSSLLPSVPRLGVPLHPPHIRP